MSEPAFRVPPNSPEAEQSVLGALLIDNGAWDRMPALRVDDFYAQEHQLIFAALAELVAAHKPADAVTVLSHLERQGKAEPCGGLAYLGALSMSVPSAAHIRQYAEIVRERSLRRRVIRIAGELQDRVYGTQDQTRTEVLVDHAVTGLLALHDSVQESEPVDMQPLAVRFIEDLEARADGQITSFPTGLSALDHLTGDGGRPGELWVIGARPSMGKTAFVLSLCRHVGVEHQVLMLTQEDSLMSLTARHVAAAGSVNLAHLRNPRSAPQEMWGGVTEAVTELSPLKISMDDQASLKMSDVRRKIQQVRRRHGSVTLVVIDYLQLMDGEGDNRNQALGMLANGLKRAAKEFNCWIVLLSQLNREADKRTGPPQMSDLRDSGDIEGAADLIGLLHRQYMRTKKEEHKYLAELHVCKHKNGRTDTIKLFFDGALQRFGNWDYDGRVD